MSGNTQVIKYCETQNKEALANVYEWHPRKVIEDLKNNIDALHFLLRETGCGDCGSGGYFFTGVHDPYTFFLYNKYGVDTCNLPPYDLDYGQWLYMTKLGFVEGCWEDYDEEGECHCCDCKPYEVERRHGSCDTDVEMDEMVDGWIVEHEARFKKETEPEAMEVDEVEPEVMEGVLKYHMDRFMKPCLPI